MPGGKRFDLLEETLDMLGDSTLLAEIRESLAEFGSGGGTTLTRDEALQRYARR